MDWIKLIEELRKKEFQFLITKGKNKFFKSILPPVQISNSLSPVFIFSSTRSGSTWLYELLLRCAKYRAIFEPLPKLDECLKIYNSPRVILSRDNHDENFNRYINTVMIPNELNKKKWKNSTINSRNIHFITKGLALKSTRANFCIDFIYKNVQDTRMKIIYLVRNPFAVIKSRIVRGSADEGQLSKKFSYDPGNLFDTKDSFFREYFSKYKAIYRKVDSRVKLEAFTWCIENKWLFDIVRQRPWHMVVYENMFLNFSDEFTKICDYVGISFKKEVRKVRNKKSTTSFNGDKRRFINSSLFENPDRFLNDWKVFFTSKEIKNVRDIFSGFEIDYNSLMKEELRTMQDLPH